MAYQTFLFSALLLGSLSAFAGANYSPDYAAGIDKSEGITSNMNDCNYAELKHQDSRLNTQYQRAMASLSEEKKRELRDAQRLWLKYKTANCGMFFTLTGGSMDSLSGSGCELDMTLERADTLEWIANISQ